MSRKHKLRLAGLYRKIENNNVCTYCGMTSNTMDHFLPLNFSSIMLEIGIDRSSSKLLVPACGECNFLAGTKVFASLGAKRRWLHLRLKRRYAKILKLPDWSKTELNDLSLRLQESIRAGLKLRDLTHKRIKWRIS